MSRKSPFSATEVSLAIGVAALILILGVPALCRGIWAFVKFLPWFS